MGKRIALLALACALVLLACMPLQRSKTDASDWMARLNDGAPLNSLSIPGTHDSGALYSIADIFGKCQTLPIEEQLRAGVRFLDIRLKLVDDRLVLMHSFVDQKTDFEDTLSQLVSFLKKHPSEFLIVSIKEESAPVRSSLSFAEALEALLVANSDVVSTDHALPETVSDARGKLHLIARYQAATIGVPAANGWTNSSSFAIGGLYVQDQYDVKSAEEKLPHIEKTFAVSASGKYALTLNYASCRISSSLLPHYAGVTARSINPWLMERLSGTQGPLGVVLCDFITSELSEQIIGRNFS